MPYTPDLWYLLFAGEGRTMLTSYQEIQCYIFNFWVQLFSLLQVLEYEDVWCKLNQVLFTTAKGHLKQLT